MTIDSRMNDLNDDVGITLLERARVLHFARGRCGNCSRSIARDSVVLLVRRKLPVSFDGTLLGLRTCGRFAKNASRKVNGLGV